MAALCVQLCPPTGDVTTFINISTGVDFLWRLVLDAPEAVSADARGLLVAIHTELGGSIADHAPRIQAAFLRYLFCSFLYRLLNVSCLGALLVDVQVGGSIADHALSFRPRFSGAASAPPQLSQCGCVHVWHLYIVATHGEALYAEDPKQGAVAAAHFGAMPYSESVSDI